MALHGLNDGSHQDIFHVIKIIADFYYAVMRSTILSVIILSVIAECHYAKCYYAECHYAACHYAECHYAECCGTHKWDSKLLLFNEMSDVLSQG